MGKARRLLETSELQEALSMLYGWRIIKGKLFKEFKFKNFAEAFGFMASIAVEAEGMNHHPDWYNVYNIVRINLITHDLGGISTFDIELARKIEDLNRKGTKDT